MTTVNRMRCRPLTTKATDIAFWLARSEFLRLVHTENYLCREIQHSYTGAYLKDWFTEPVGAELPGLWLPTVHLSKGRIAFINGRHRTSVLLEHLDRLPMAMAEEDASDLLFLQVNQATIDLQDVIELPELPLFAQSDFEPFIDRKFPRIPTPDPW
jgi:hypothetical protein